MQRLLIASTVVGAAAGGAAADLSYIAQVREIYAGAGTNQASAAAGDFGVFSESRTVAYAPGFVDDTTASQTSSLHPDQIVGTGMIVVDDGNQGWGGTGRSLLDVTFSVDEATAYSLAGSWMGHVSINTSPSIFVRLSDASGVLFNSEVQPEEQFGWSDEFDTSGVLLPGTTYRLEALLSWTHQSLAGNLSPVTATFDVALVVPGPGGTLLALLPGGFVAGVRRRRR